ncbi:phage/plasmid primase, P4 family [Streptomyces sp. NPDC059166]|uniref:phage/plasmid primase, P4 family n=1 Tax=Streptomyces sp. NPDC059166 TaxID=3346752 RepID=UPI0036D00337
MSDSMIPEGAPKRRKAKKAAIESKLTGKYRYVSTSNKLMYEVRKFEPGKNGRKKDFVPGIPMGGVFQPGKPEGVDDLIYNAHDVAKAVRTGNASTVLYDVEGEKDADRLKGLGYVAFTTQGGAENWQESSQQYVAGFKGTVIIVPDEDQAGYRLAARKLKAYEEMGIRAMICAVPEGKDISDHVGVHRRTVDKLDHLTREDVEARIANPYLERVKRALALAGHPVENGMAQCPTHDDNSPSLSVGQGDDQSVTMFCHGDRAGCTYEGVLEFLKIPQGEIKKLKEQEEAEKARIANSCPEPTDPMAVARYIRGEFMLAGVPNILYWRGDWYRWDGSLWREFAKSDFRAMLYMRMENETFIKYDSEGKPRRVRWAPTASRINNLMDACEAIYKRADGREPMTREDGSRAKVVPFQNGVYDIVGLGFTEPNPDLFNLYALDFDYKPSAECPVWMEKLKEWFNGDDESIRLLREWMAYLIVGETRLQKIMSIIGPRRSGKGTIGRVMERLMTEHATAGPSLHDLAELFGRQELIGKSLALVADSRFEANRADRSKVIDFLLRVSGEDPVQIPRKNREAWKGKMGIRFTILSNDLIRLGDSSNAMTSRFMVLNTPNSYEGKEDPKLSDKLYAELSGIFNWAIEAWDELDERGAFLMPAASGEFVEAMFAADSPEKAFLIDACEFGLAAEHHCAKDDFWSQWVQYCEKSKNSAGTYNDMLRRFTPVIKEYSPTFKAGRKGRGTERYHAFFGVSLKVQPGENGKFNLKQESK